VDTLETAKNNCNPNDPKQVQALANKIDSVSNGLTNEQLQGASEADLKALLGASQDVRQFAAAARAQAFGKAGKYPKAYDAALFSATGLVNKVEGEMDRRGI
jgi:hypothetical protein